VPNLTEEDAAFGVNGVDDGFPCFHVLSGPYAGRVRVALSGVGDSGGFGDEKAAVGGSLRIIEDGVRLRNVVVGPLSGEWRQHHSVREVESPHLVGSDQRIRWVSGRGCSHGGVRVEFDSIWIWI